MDRHRPMAVAVVIGGALFSPHLSFSLHTETYFYRTTIRSDFTITKRLKKYNYTNRLSMIIQAFVFQDRSLYLVFSMKLYKFPPLSLCGCRGGCGDHTTVWTAHQAHHWWAVVGTGPVSRIRPVPVTIVVATLAIVIPCLAYIYSSPDTRDPVCRESPHHEVLGRWLSSASLHLRQRVI